MAYSHTRPSSLPFIRLPYCRLAAVVAAVLASSWAVRAQTQDRSTNPDVVLMTPFDVNSATDQGYLTANAVSATRISANIADLPFSVTAFTEQYIADTGAQNLMEIASQSAGVKSGVSTTTQGNAMFSIRGFVQAPQRNGFSSNALVNNYVDASVVERVEVVKGPASLLYGEIAPGGTVNYITKSPEANTAVDLRVFGGSYDYAGTSLDLNQPLIPGVLYFRVVGTFENGEEYYQNQHSRTEVVYPALKWLITPKMSLSIDYQGYQERQSAPAVYLPNTDIGTPASIVKALYGVGYPGASSALANNGSPQAVAQGFQDSSDPGFMAPFPGLPKNFNYSDVNDTRLDNLKTFNAVLETKFDEHWSSRIHAEVDNDHTFITSTGHGSTYSAPPNSLVYSGGVWSVAPAWAALSPAQQTAETLAYAQQAVVNPSLLYSTQNGVPSPVVLDRAPRYNTQTVNAVTLQAETVGDYHLPWAHLQLLGGIFYDRARYGLLGAQNQHTAASPFFRTWDVDPASPTYYINPNDGGFNAASLTQISSHTLSTNSDKAAYGLLNASFFDNRLFLVGGARYNVSSNQVYDFNAGSASPGLSAKYTTPQVGLGYKLLPGTMIYASYSESYTLSTQPFLTKAGTVDGVPTTIPTGPTSPTIGKGYETGLKFDFLNDTLEATVAVYQIEEDDVIQDLNENVNGFGIDIWNQGAKQRGRGVEGQISWAPMTNWQIVTSVAEEDIRNIAEPAGLEYYLGQNVGYVAKPAAHLWSRYDFTFPALKGGWIGAGFDYSGRNAGDPRDAAYYLPAYTVVNAALGYDWKVNRLHFSAALNFKNIGNTAYKDTPESIGEPRRILASLTLHY